MNTFEELMSVVMEMNRDKFNAFMQALKDEGVDGESLDNIRLSYEMLHNEKLVDFVFEQSMQHTQNS